MKQRTLLLTLPILVLFLGCSEEPKPEAQPADVQRKVEKLIDENPVEEQPTGSLVVTTEPEGFYVIVDGELARADNGTELLTPCVLEVREGKRAVRVARPGFNEDRKDVEVTAEEKHEVTFEPTAHPQGETTGLIADALFTHPVGKPIALSELNVVDKAMDPFLSSDGLRIYFAGEKSFRKGIYKAERTQIYDRFGPPKLVPGSQGADSPASPSILDAGGKVLIYTTPEKGRIWSLPLTLFSGEMPKKKLLTLDRAGRQKWPSAQISRDGLRLYWVAEEKGTRRTYAARRNQTSRKFVEQKEITLPGRHPCMTSDGLKQFLFDGRRVEVARRSSAEKPFSKPILIAELELPGLVFDGSRRQYWVSEDGEWLYYCNNPRGAADLYLVRLPKLKSERTIASAKRYEPPKVAVADPKPMPMVDPGPKPPVTPDPPKVPALDPTKPHPYAVYRAEFLKLMNAGKIDEAIQFASAAKSKPHLDKSAEVLGWDLVDARRINNFWNSARSAFSKLNPGDEIMVSGITLKFESFKDDKVHAATASSKIQKLIKTFRDVDLFRVMDAQLGKDNVKVQMEMAMFLYFRPKSSAKAAQLRFSRAGKLGELFNERLAHRALHLAKLEVARGNGARAVEMVKSLQKNHAKSKAAQESKKVVADLYAATKWEAVKREWTTQNAGEFRAPPGRVAGAWLKSPRQTAKFELHLEWKAEGALGGGGVIFHYPGNGDPYQNAWKIPLKGDAGIAADPNTTGALQKYQAPKSNMAKRTGEWNSLVLSVDGSKVEATINGRKILEAPARDEGRSERGYILLDGELGGISYRKILLLTAAEAPAKKPDDMEPKLKDDKK